METYTDPVCGEEVTANSAQAVSEHEGRTYYFHSIECKVTFDKDPELYVKQDQDQEHRR